MLVPWAWAWLLVLGSAAPGHAVADEGSGSGDALRLLVVAPGVSAERVEEVYEGLRAAGLLTVGLEERAGVDRPPSAATAPGMLDEARAALARARVAFRQLELDAAREAAAAAHEELLRLARPEMSRETLADVLILEAWIALQRDDDKDARQTLALLARLEPTRDALHGGLYPPSLVEAYASARAWALAQPPATLVVRPRVARFDTAEAVVDGLPVAGGEMRLLAGPHLVTVRAPRAGSLTRVVTLVPGEPVFVEPFLAAPGADDARTDQVARAAAASERTDDAAVAAALGEVAALCAAKAVLFLGPRRVQLWAPGRALEVMDVSPDAPGVAIGQFTLAALQAPARVAVGLRSPGDGPSTWGPLWLTLGGAGALALAASGLGIAIWALSPPAPPPPPPRPVVVTCCVD